MGANHESLPGINGLAHATRAPGICVLSVTWGLLSIVVLTRYMHSLIGVEDVGARGEKLDDNVQVVARPDLVQRLELYGYFGQK